MEKVRIALRVKKEIDKRMQELAIIEKWSKSKIAEVAVEFYLNARKV